MVDPESWAFLCSASTLVRRSFPLLLRPDLKHVTGIRAEIPARVGVSWNGSTGIGGIAGVSPPRQASLLRANHGLHEHGSSCVDIPSLGRNLQFIQTNGETPDIQRTGESAFGGGIDLTSSYGGRRRSWPRESRSEIPDDIPADEHQHCMGVRE
ncbi:hypothetical protein LZ30DRAFT_685874 [Colletotrichum cereale]|nr:hypothetical protein LZ30DRAFT_685874 [Colletotrichum cereale]